MVKAKVTSNLKDLNLLVPRVRREFAIIAPDPIKRVIKNDIQSGVSPVKGKGRFIKYSPSYKQQIRGETAFRKTKDGRTFAITTKGIKGKGSRKRKQAFKEKIEDLNEVFTKFKKRVTPVSLTLSGKMIRSLIVRPSLALTNKFKMLISFTDDTAEFHNSKGAGKSGVLRRLLPTNAGEKFNTKIESTMRNLLNKSVSNIVKRFK